MNKNNFKSGFISLVGRTNVGKSTLLNNLVGQKVSIISDKPQTTRNNIRAIRTTDTSQMVFIDTPGFHKPKTKLSNFMVESANSSIGEVDVILMLVEEDEKIGKGDRMLLDKLSTSSVPVILVINKIDKVKKEDILNKINLYKEFDFIKEIIPISALNSENTDSLIKLIEKYLPNGPMYFPEDMLTDRAEKFLVGEIVREKLLVLLKDEVPHGIACEVMSMKERDDKDLMDIEINIYCERKTHKGIIIGKSGAMLKKVATLARKDMENLLGIQVNLQIWVKIKESWRDKPFDLKDFGYKDID